MNLGGVNSHIIDHRALPHSTQRVAVFYKPPYTIPVLYSKALRYLMHLLMYVCMYLFIIYNCIPVPVPVCHYHYNGNRFAPETASMLYPEILMHIFSLATP